MHTNTADDSKRSQQIVRSPESRAKTNNLNHRISAATLRHLLDSLHHALPVFRKIEWLGPQLRRKLKPALHTIHSKDVFGPVFQGRYDGAQPDRSAPDHNHGSLASGQGLDQLERVLGAKVSGREDIRHQDEGVVADLRRGLHRGAVGEGNADVLGLTAVELAAAEQQGVRAAGGEPVAAVKAFSAGSCEGGDDLVSDFDGLDVAACFCDSAGELVAHDEARVGLLVTSEDMEFS